MNDIIILVIITDIFLIASLSIIGLIVFSMSLLKYEDSPVFIKTELSEFLINTLLPFLKKNNYFILSVPNCKDTRKHK